MVYDEDIEYRRKKIGYAAYWEHPVLKKRIDFIEELDLKSTQRALSTVHEIEKLSYEHDAVCLRR